jgi:hypothetical protein
MKDPSKMMNLMKTVGSKLDNKMKSGEISREELMKEASEMMDKMTDMGGGDQFNDMFKNLAKNMGSMGKNMKVDTNALDRMTKMMSTKERLRAKAEQKKQNRVEEQAQQIAEMKKRMEEQEKLLAKVSDVLFQILNRESKKRLLAPQKRLRIRNFKSLSKQLNR